MTCVICRHGQTKPGSVSVTLERNGTTLVFKSVPAQVCDNCGEQYLDSTTSSRLMQEADKAAESGIQLEVRSYAAA